MASFSVTSTLSFERYIGYQGWVESLIIIIASVTYSKEIFIVQCFCKPVFLAMKYLFLQSCTWKVDARFVQCFCKPVFLAMKYLFLQSCTWKVDARFVEFVERPLIEMHMKRRISCLPRYLFSSQWTLKVVCSLVTRCSWNFFVSILYLISKHYVKHKKINKVLMSYTLIPSISYDSLSIVWYNMAYLRS